LTQFNRYRINVRQGGWTATVLGGWDWVFFRFRQRNHYCDGTTWLWNLHRGI